MRNEFIEGEETMLAYKGPVKSVIDGISDGLKSAMSYMNCYTLDEFKEINSFAVLSNSSFLERLPKKYLRNLRLHFLQECPLQINID